MKTAFITLLMILSLTFGAEAATFTVTTVEDSGDGICNTSCTLREAIDAANANPGADTIAFDIPGSGVRGIVPFTPLPFITETVTIDGYTQPGASANTLEMGSNAVILIELIGSMAGDGSGLVLGAPDCTVRGLAINRFPEHGITVGENIGDAATDTGIVVEGNFIGTDATGTASLANLESGILIFGDESLIGGSLPAARNLISGNAAHGVRMLGTSSSAVQGNLIGTDAGGSLALPNGISGVLIFGGTANLIGGREPGLRNIISGNGGDGVRFFQSGIVDGVMSAHVVEGNYIGTDATGNTALGNAGNGVSLIGFVTGILRDNFIGGATTGAGNVISGNAVGILIEGATENMVVFDNTVQGNLIGTDASGAEPVPNSLAGIRITVDADGTIIGGPGAAANTIAFNGGPSSTAAGIEVSGVGTGNNFFGNAIFGNSGLGIDLVGGVEDMSGVTANDFPDSDGGANGLQNYPMIETIAVSGRDRTVEGQLASNGGTDYTLDFYSNSEVDPSGFGEGETWLGFLDVQTNAQGLVDFTFPLEADALGRFITATATDPDGNTSEFSMASEVVPPLSQFLNISTRLRVQTGDNVLIGGFIIDGTEAKEVIVRAIGPSLGDLGVADPLANPILELHYPGDATVLTNNNWRVTQEAEIMATGLAPDDDLESAIVATLDPGAYTAIVRGVNAGTGVALVETYDLSAGLDSALANISTRGLVETGDNVMIGGIIVGPELAPAGSILLRAIGPSLSNFGIANPLANPMLELRDSNGALVVSNDNWKSSQQAAIEATGLQPSDDNEAAILAALATGSYTAIMSGVGGTTGIGLVEAYHLD